jgi:hypothetical protein
MSTSLLSNAGMVVERPGVDLSRLRDCDRWSLALSEGLTERLRVHAALPVRADTHNPIMAEPQELESREHGGVGLRSDQDVNGGRSKKTAVLHIPAYPAQNLATGGCKADKIGGCGSCNEANRSFPREVQEIKQPSGRYRFGGSRRWRRGVVACILSPR